MAENGARDGCCGRPSDDKDSLLSDAGLDRVEEAVLAVIRYYFQAFAVPQSQAWMAAIDIAEASFGKTHGGAVAARVMEVLRAMRSARRSTFMFNSPLCPGCAALLTEHERRLIMGFAALRRGASGQARIEAMMLCEGNPSETMIDAMRALSAALPPPAALQGRNGYVSV